MIKAHKINHGVAKETLIHSRNMAWIHQGRFVAAKVAKDCMACLIKVAKVVTQKMGQIYWNRTTLGSPLAPYHPGYLWGIKLQGHGH